MTSELRESIGQLINDCERRIDHLEKAISSPFQRVNSATCGQIIENRRFILRLQTITKREKERRDDE